MTSQSKSLPEKDNRPPHTVDLPLGAMKNGRLLFTAGAANLMITADPRLAARCRAQFESPDPVVRDQEGTVTIDYRFSRRSWVRGRRPARGEITLNTSIPWELEFRGGVSRLTANLRALTLRALDLGSVSRAQIKLPAPTQAAFIYIGGSASSVTIQTPADTAVRLRIDGSSDDITLHGSHFSAQTGGLLWQTDGYEDAADRYDVSIAGSASGVTVDTW